MANGYFERGEIYKIRMDYGVGVEEGAFRPGLIISSNRVNNTSGLLLVAYLSRKSAGRTRSDFDVEVMATGISSFVLCNQIAGIDKSRLMGCMGKLNPIEQKAVDDILEDIIDLGYVDDTLLKQKDSEIADRDALIGDLKNEVTGYKTELEKRDEEIASLKMEIEMWQKCYGRCMDMLVEVKVNADVQRRTVEPPVVGMAASLDMESVQSPKQPESPKEEMVGELETDDQDGKVDINTCTVTALKKIGFSVSLARAVVAARPFKSLEDLKGVPGMAKTRYRIVEPRLWCSKVKDESPMDDSEPEAAVVVNEETTTTAKKPKVVWDGVKVNVNTVKSITDLMSRTGMCQRTASEIIRHREKFGDYESISDLTNLTSFGGIAMKRYGHMLEV